MASQLQASRFGWLRWPARPSRNRLIGGAFLAVALLAVVGAGSQVADLWWSWRSLERTSFDQDDFAALPPVDVADTELAATDPDLAEAIALASPIADPTDPYLTDEVTAYLIVGSDEGDRRADVIMLALLPTEGSAPVLVSLPRDLYLPNRCTGGLTRINANYNGCGPDLNGPTQLAGAVADFTGVEIDHFALFTMNGFERIIDAVGGMEICLENPVREGDELSLPAGCTQADGSTALSWVRSRQTQELVDGRWRTMPQVSDLTRNQRQQDLLLAVLAKTAEFDSPTDLTRFAGSLSDAFTLDDGLGLADAAELAWANRDLSADNIMRLTIPVQPYVTSGGAQVLLPDATFAEVLANR